MPTYDWACPHGHSFTARAGYDDKYLACNRCDETASRVQVYRVSSTGFAKEPPGNRDFSREYKNAQEAGAEMEYQHERLKDATQIADLQPPPLYRMAKAKAKELRKKGVTSASDL